MAEHKSRTGLSAAFLLLNFLIVPCLCVLTGCGVSAPRFRSEPRVNNQSQIADPSEHFTDSSAVRTELMEDDKNVDISSVLLTIDTSHAPLTGINKKKVMDEILALVGTPYSLNGTGGSGIDCSGFTASVYANAIGKDLPHSASAQFLSSRKVEDEDKKFGDLVFFNTTGEVPSHVGIYLGEDLFAHASVSSGVTISSLESSYYKKRYVGVRRVIE